MSDIEELHQRITLAMERVEAGLDQLEHPGGTKDNLAPSRSDAEKVLVLEKLLEKEKERNTRLAGQMQSLDLELQKLRHSNEELRRATLDLRNALAGGNMDATLINSTLAREVEALHADRAVEAAQTTAIIENLTPLLTEAEGAA